MSILTLHLLGKPTIHMDNTPISLRRRKAVALIIYLACNSKPIERRFISDMLWSEAVDSRAGLRRLLYEIRDTPSHQCLTIDDHTIGIRPEYTLHIDAHRYEELLTINPVDETAISLYHGHFLEDFKIEDAPKFQHWVLQQRDYYRHLYADSLNNIIKMKQDTGDFLSAIDHTKKLLEVEPFSEPTHRMLIRLYAQVKQHEQAIFHYHQLVHLLRDELGMNPQEATRSLYEQLLRIEVRAEDTDPLTVRPTVNRITRSLSPPKPNLLIGRDGILTTLQDSLVNAPSTHILFGTIGVGKTALVAQIAHGMQVRDVYSDGILWATLGKQPAIAALQQTWCDVLNLSPASSVNTTTMMLRSALAGKRYLVIVDDVWSAEDLAHFQVTDDTSSLLVTTRFQTITQAFTTLSPSTYVPPLDHKDSIELLRRFNEFAVDDVDNLDDIITRVGGLPLALNMVGQQLNEEWEFGLIDDFVLQMEDIALLMSQTTSSDRFASPLDSGAILQARFMAVLSDEANVTALEIIKKLTPHIQSNQPFTIDDVKTIAHNEGIRTVLRDLINMGIIYNLGRGQFYCHPLWLAVI